MNTDTDPVDELERVTQRIVPAAGQVAHTTAPNSVFAVGNGRPPADDADTAEASAPAASIEEWLARAVKCFESCGELSRLQLQEALGCNTSRAYQVVTMLTQSQQVVQLRKDGVVPVYGLASKELRPGFKGWLQRQAQDAPAAAAKPAHKRRGRKPAAMPPPSAPAAAKRPAAKAGAGWKKAAAADAVRDLVQISAHAPAHVVMPIPAGSNELALGVFSSGEIAIEMDGQVLRLNPARARRLVDWALRVDALLSLGGV